MSINVVSSTIELDLSGLKNKIDENLIKRNIAHVLQTQVARNYVELVMEEFEKFSSFFDDEDPAAPSNWAGEFRAKLEREAQETVSIDGNSVSVSFGERSFLGYDEEPDPSEDTPLIWFIYYLEGIAGEYGFIDERTFAAKKPSVDISKYGRFGKGFMVSKDMYFKEGWYQIKPWDEARFPFSDSGPNDFFLTALARLRVDSDSFALAIKAALEGKLLG